MKGFINSVWGSIVEKGKGIFGSKTDKQEGVQERQQMQDMETEIGNLNVFFLYLFFCQIK